VTPPVYLAALYAAGLSRSLSFRDLDRQAAALLLVNERTARRYRLGEIDVPGPVEVALRCLVSSRMPRQTASNET
jgi:hypothetical protein